MNDQVASALAQFRDIHEPPVPPFWPLPIGWWLLITCILICLVAVGWWWVRRRRLDRPYNEIRHLASEVQKRFLSASLLPDVYVDNVNRIYRHLLVNVEQVPGAAQADGATWLAMLASRFDDEAFTQGAGKALGAVRYTPYGYFNESLVDLVERTLCSVRFRPRLVT